MIVFYSVFMASKTVLYLAPLFITALFFIVLCAPIPRSVKSNSTVWNLVATYHTIPAVKRTSEFVSGKATAVFGKMRKMWKNKCIGLKVKMRWYEAIILSTLL